MEFIERVLIHSEGKLATYVAGTGPQLVFVHGGPGETNHSIRKLALPLLAQYQCILYDQRGNGGSALEELSFESLAINKHFDDLMQIRQAYGIEKLTLIGHSWGAILSLMFAAANPTIVERVILLGLGPLDEEMSAVANANLLRVLLPEERQQWQRLRRERKEAMAAGQENRLQAIEGAILDLRVRACIYRPELREAYLQDYSMCPPINRAINEVVAREALQVFRWSSLDTISAKLFIGQGLQDYVPLQQAFRIRERLGRVEIRLWNECGHLPWYDQPQLMYWDLKSFLSGG
jgi:proline iminopeptidase